ncbi:unnamed protein product [Polarella glacialis]|uniref:Uncharacterized protein n=2 Tax=Polarella glacialis TaxID=89957 RepID=A0A813EMM4_POLGL|nr:unnamed protein product [Polarella glacialis]
MGLGCGKALLPNEPPLPADAQLPAEPSEFKEEDDWRVLLASSPGDRVQSSPSPPSTRQGLAAAPPAGVRNLHLQQKKLAPPEPSAAAVKAAARAGVPLPNLDEDEPYGLMDDYVDDLLGIPKNKRSGPTLRAPGAALQGAVPQIIFGDGTRGVPEKAMPRMDKFAEEAPGFEPSDLEQAVVLESASPYMAGVLGDWASIDKTLVKTQVAQQAGPAPKRKAGASSGAR